LLHDGLLVWNTRILFTVPVHLLAFKVIVCDILRVYLMVTSYRAWRKSSSQSSSLSGAVFRLVDALCQSGIRLCPFSCKVSLRYNAVSKVCGECVVSNTHAKHRDYTAC